MDHVLEVSLLLVLDGATLQLDEVSRWAIRIEFRWTKLAGCRLDVTRHFLLARRVEVLLDVNAANVGIYVARDGGIF